jgi:adenylate kinase
MTDPAAASDGRLILLLVGPAGAGKGTQAAILSRALGLAHLASGDLFRSAMAAGTELGREARAYMERGELVPDELTIAMVRAELEKPAAAAGAVLDGFPRTVGQAEALDRTLAERGERIGGVVAIEVSSEELVRRVAGRWVCPSCGTPYHLVTDAPRRAGVCDRDGTALVQREDDRPEVVLARLAKQVPPMREVLAHYERAGVVERVDGERPIEDVTGDILRRLRAAGRVTA